MKKISLLVIALIFIGTASQADQKNEAKENAEDQKQVSLGELLKPNVESLITNGAGDGICPVVGIQWFDGLPIFQYPPTSADPDCPPN